MNNVIPPSSRPSTGLIMLAMIVAVAATLAYLGYSRHNAGDARVYHTPPAASINDAPPARPASDRATEIQDPAITENENSSIDSDQLTLPPAETAPEDGFTGSEN